MIALVFYDESKRRYSKVMWVCWCLLESSMDEGCDTSMYGRNIKGGDDCGTVYKTCQFQ